MNTRPDHTTVELTNCLHHLNVRAGLAALAQWKGVKTRLYGHGLYDGWTAFLSPGTLDRIAAIDRPADRRKLRFAFIDHFLQEQLSPFDAELRSWSGSAAADVNGDKIYLRDVIPWCQKTSTRLERLELQKETTALCRFLKPFALAYWKALMAVLADPLGYDSYVDFCGRKKHLDYGTWYRRLRRFMAASDTIYGTAMDDWCHRVFSCPTADLTRFDAIHLLGLAEVDHLMPTRPVTDHLSFFHAWGIDPTAIAGLSLDLGTEERKSAQAMSFILQAPEEVYILMKPEGGWIDIETLWHELGHGLSAVGMSPDLPVLERDFPTSFSLSEAYAFLLQNLVMTRPFLTTVLGIDAADTEQLVIYRELRNMAAFRRYGAKFIAEYEMFASGHLSDGGRYAEVMQRYTGFYHQPESHLFDLVPEFYCLDYLFGWMAEAAMRDHLEARFGPAWMMSPEAGARIRHWWAQGNSRDAVAFMAENGLGPLDPDRLLTRWTALFG